MRRAWALGVEWGWDMGTGGGVWGQGRTWGWGQGPLGQDMGIGGRAWALGGGSAGMGAGGEIWGVGMGGSRGGALSCRHEDQARAAPPHEAAQGHQGVRVQGVPPQVRAEGQHAQALQEAHW